MNKKAVDLKKLPDHLDSRFTTTEWGDDLLEIQNPEGFPLTVYVNSDGDIWSSKVENGVDSAKGVKEVAKKVREFVAKRADNSFKVSEMIKMLAPPMAEIEEPKLDEDSVIDVGSEVTDDILKEPELKDLSPEDTHQVAIMVFDVLLDDKKNQLQDAGLHVARKLAADFNNIFQNMSFINSGEYLSVFFNQKVSRNKELSKDDIKEVFKLAFSDVGLVEMYNDAVKDVSKKISSSQPDYFRLRDIIISEVMEQLNGKK